MSKGGMQSSAVRNQLCPICGKSVSVQIRNFQIYSRMFAETCLWKVLEQKRLIGFLNRVELI